ncbi:MAG: secondary thiamine-phosphate synthase enzyme YjbQ [Bryobacterales bacterium]
MTSSILPLTTTSRDAMPAGAAAPFRVFSRRVECATIKRFEIIDLTGRVAETIAESGIDNGVVHVQTLHTTTALFLNERQAALLDDVEALVRLLVDDGRDWRHNDRRYSDCDRGNAAAHLRSLLVGHSLSIQVQDGQPVLGKWQAVQFLEMDGPQARKLSVQVMGV